MKTPMKIAMKYAGDAMVVQLAKAIEDYGEEQYNDGHGTGYGKGKSDANIMGKRGY